MPDNMRRARNRALFLTLIQVALSVCSIILWERRRNRIILIATIASIVMSLVGVFATLRVNSLAMFFHSFYFCSFLGAFYIYLIFDFLFFDTSEHGGLSDTGIMFLLSLPFLCDFLIGCYSMYLFNMVYDERKARKQDQVQRRENNLPQDPLERPLLRP